MAIIVTESELLEKALYSSATIHQPHALKAYLAARNLYGLFGQTDELWLQVSKLISKSELQVSCSYTDSMVAPKFSDLRISRILNGGIYPAAYQALAQWHCNMGFDDIFRHYIALAAGKNEYLSHNVTILLAFNSLYGELTNDQINPFLNRVTEFVTSTFRSSSQAVQTEPYSSHSFRQLIEASLNQPSFFGHNLITLAWIMRCRDMLTDDQLTAISHHLYIQATSPLDDPEDAIDQKIFALCNSTADIESFRENIRALTFDVCHNLHQVTLADALCFLQKQFPEHIDSLGRIAEYSLRILKA
jgi:hypothetical protein